jgi:hypothetical protein
LVTRVHLFSIALALGVAFAAVALPQVAHAAENRPATPALSSPTNSNATAVAGNLVTSGTGTPGGVVFVNVFASLGAYSAAVTRDERSYQDFESGQPLGGSGGRGALVGSDRRWTFTLSSADIQQAATGSAIYVAAFEFVSGVPGQYPASKYTPAVLVPLTALGQPAPPKFTGLGSPAVLQERADGTLVLSGSGLPGATIVGFVDATKAGMTADLGRFRQQKTVLGSACPTGNSFCATAAVTSKGTWTFRVDAKTARSAHNGTLLISAAQADTRLTTNRWSVPATPMVVTVQFDTLGPATASTPSVFSQLTAFRWSTFTPAHVALTVGAALVLTLLLGLPTALLNAALEESYDERARRLRRIAEPLARLGKRVAANWKRATTAIPKPIGTIGWFLLAAVVAGFADPTFGFNLESLRLLVSLFLAFGLLNVLGAYVTWWATASTSHTRRPTFPSRPSNLVILVITVIVARLIHLEPALVFGSVLGLDFGVKLAVSRKVRVIVVGAAYAAVIGILGWLAFSAMPQASTAFWPVALREFFSQIAVAGIATLPVTLLPFKYLNGETIFRWRRVVWAVSYGVGLALFLLILLPMPFSWTGVSEPLVAWICLFLGYSILAVLIWCGVRFHWFARRKHTMPVSKSAS